MARIKIDHETIKKINELYLEIKTYAGVSRALGGSPSPTTVKKYIIEGYKSAPTIKDTFKEEDLPEFNREIFLEVENFGDLCIHTEEEKEEIKKLWEELQF